MPGCNTAQYKRLQRVLPCKCNLYRSRHKTERKALQGLFLRLQPLNRPQYQTDTNGYNTTRATLEHLPTPQQLQHIPDTTAAHGRYTGQHSPPIIIWYIRGGPCQRWRGLDASHARRLEVWHRVSCQGRAPSTRRGSPATRARRAARNHWRLSPHLFSGFRPIANRGQQ